MQSLSQLLVYMERFILTAFPQNNANTHQQLLEHQADRSQASYFSGLASSCLNPQQEELHRT
jgi:hypothetical protein